MRSLLNVICFCFEFFSWKKPQFDGKSIRIVLFVESDSGGRRQIFDSKAVVREDNKVLATNIQMYQTPR